jgi:hypothetical protein
MRHQVMPIPSIGRIVHYHAARGLTLPAVVYHVYQPGEPEGPVDLVTFGDAGAMPLHRVPFGDPEELGRWSWPPFVPPAPPPADELEPEDDSPDQPRGE